MSYDIKNGISNREEYSCIATNAGAGANIEFPIFVAPGNCIVRQVTITPRTSTVRLDTAFHTFYIYDKGSAGTASNVIVSGSTANVNSGTQSLLSFDEVDIKNISSGNTYSSTHNILAAGDVISFANVSGGTAAVIPDMLVKITYELMDIKEPAY